MPYYTIRTRNEATGAIVDEVVKAVDLESAAGVLDHAGLTVVTVLDATERDPRVSHQAQRLGPLDAPPAVSPASPTPAVGTGSPLSRVRITIAGLSLVGALGTFMPWVSIPIAGTINGTRGDGWVTLACFAIAMLVGLSPSPSSPITFKRRLIAAIMGVFAAIIAMAKIGELSETLEQGRAARDLSGAMMQMSNIGSGLWIITICGLVMGALALFLPEPQVT